MRSTLKKSFIPRRLNRYLAMFALLTSMSGCSTKVLIAPSVPYQANLTEKCPVILPRLAGNTGTDFDTVLQRYTRLYADCAARHNQLVTEMKLRQELKK